MLPATSDWKSALAFAAILIFSLLAVGLFAVVEQAARVRCPWSGTRGGH